MATGPSRPPPRRRPQYTFLPWQAAAVGLLLVPISSALGAQAWKLGFFWIWRPSILADVVFVLGTIGAQMLASRAGTGQPTALNTATIAFVVGLGAHWVVYTISWNLVVPFADDYDLFIYHGFWFTLGAGWRGLAISVLAGVVGGFAHRRRVKSPSR